LHECQTSGCQEVYCGKDDLNSFTFGELDETFQQDLKSNNLSLNEAVAQNLPLQSRDAPIIGGRFADNQNRPITMPVSADCYLLCIMMAFDIEIIYFLI